MIDCHCHLDLYTHPEKIADYAEKNGITVIGVTQLPSHFKIGLQHTKKYKKIRLALGLHPLLANQHQQEYSLFKKCVNSTSYIGEIGLDNSKEGRDTIKIQEYSFRFVLENIKQTPKFISIHSRGAEAKVLEILNEFGITNAVFHWYSGPISILKQAIQAGHYFSINLAMLNSSKGRDIIKAIPKARLLTETDGPYLTFKGQPISPKNIADTLRLVSKIWEEDVLETEKQIKTNFKKIISRITK